MKNILKFAGAVIVVLMSCITLVFAAGQAQPEVTVKNQNGLTLRNDVFSYSDKFITSEIKNTDSADSSEVLLMAAYDEEDNIISISSTGDLNIAPGETAECVLSLDSADRTVKSVRVFVWRDFESAEPISEMIVLTNELYTYRDDANSVFVSVEGSDSDGDGTFAKPFRTVDFGVSKLSPGKTLYLMEGTYKENIYVGVKGTVAEPITIKAAPGAHAVIDGGGKLNENIIELESSSSDIIISDLELQNGWGGIYSENSTSKSGKNFAVCNNKIHDIDGNNDDTFAVVFYAKNVNPVTNVIIDGNEIYNCKTYTSETVTLNGNVDGFRVSNNIIHDCNNIGLDAIGYEGTCKTKELDCARNGVFRDNTVYNVSTYGNEGYKDGSGYDLCCAGIYIDGGHDIEILDNNIYNCDIGVEVASESTRAPYNISYNVSVNNNIISECKGLAGICFGGYDNKVGWTKQCDFVNNTLYNNIVGIMVQQAEDNIISQNIIYGGENGLVFSFADEDGKLVYKGVGPYNDTNNFGANYWYDPNSVSGYNCWFDMLPVEQLSKQITGVDPKFKSPKQNNFSTELNALGYGAIR